MMQAQIDRIKSTFQFHYKYIGSTKDEMLDELDMAAYQLRWLRNTSMHDDLLRWGEKFLRERLGG